jgi:hypothetical protein
MPSPFILNIHEKNYSLFFSGEKSRKGKENQMFQLHDMVRAGGSEHADFPQRGKSAPIQPSLFSPSERNRARSGFIGDSSPPTLTMKIILISWILGCFLNKNNCPFL